MTELTLKDRLLTMYSHRGDGIPTQYVNPDGPDAAAELQRLTDERDALMDEVDRLREHITGQTAHVETRIQDGVELGATVWRIALEDVASDNHAVL